MNNILDLTDLYDSDDSDNSSSYDSWSIDSSIDSDDTNNSTDSDITSNDEMTKEEIIDKIKYLQRLINYKNNIKINVKKCDYMSNNFKIKSTCCDKTYCCSQCHNFNSTHKINIKKTNIICNSCDIEQEYGNYCIACDEKLKTIYSCKKCYIFDNTNKYKFHCDKCNKCHQDNVQTKYCNNCNICYVNTDNHICVDLNENCCICLEKLINGTIFNLKCGHIIHAMCYKNLIKTTYKCPLCCKSVKDMTNEFKKIDDDIEENSSYDSADKIYKNIYCNDCGKKSLTQYHYLGIKCKNCNSYNTIVI